MKKLTLLVALASLSIGSAVAADGLNFGKLDYTFRDYDGTGSNRNGAEITLGRQIVPGFVVDGRAELLVTNGSENTANRLEAGASILAPLTSDITGFVRGAVGERFVSGDRYSYYSVEPGVSVALNKEWGVNTSYRFRDSFSSNTVGAESHLFRVGTSYALTENTSVTASIGRVWGDEQYNVVNVGYGFKF